MGAYAGTVPAYASCRIRGGQRGVSGQVRHGAGTSADGGDSEPPCPRPIPMPPHIAPKRGPVLSYQRNVDAKGAVAVALCLHRWAAFDFFPELGGMGSNDAGHPRMLTVTTLHEGGAAADYG